MNLREAWKLSKVPYVEIAYRSVQLSRGAEMMKSGSLTKTPQEQIASVIKNAKTSKIIFTVFVCIGTAIPFAQILMAPGPISVVSAVSLSLAIGLAYLVLYSLQILPSFASAEPYSLLLTLPFARNDFSLVTMLSFVRTFDYLAIGCILVPVVGVALLTGSAIATILILGGTVINTVFAIAIGLWFSGLFYRNITRGGRSRGGSIARLVFLITWGLAAMSIGFLFNVVISLLPLMNHIISGNLAQWSGVILSILHPFAFGLAIAYLVYPSFASGSATSLIVLSFGAVAAYIALAYAASRRTLRTIASISHGQGITIIRESAKEFTLKIRKPFFAYVMKDLRVAAKSPSTAMIFALPFFETVIIAMSISGVAMSTPDLVIATIMGCLFTLMVSSFLLNTERAGLGYTMSLPIGAGIVINAKSFISTLVYLPVPALILVLQILKPGVSSLFFLVPLIEILAVSAGTTAEIAMFISGSSSKQISQPGASSQVRTVSTGFSVMAGSDIGLLIKALIISGIIVAAPLITYVASLVLYASKRLS
ncbi:MAG: hypothetical protein M1368_01555, partial [Thaumarchaeota archaeon]|nr:hypothetical protein [Nitrososphaerota archaeon]